MSSLTEQAFAGIWNDIAAAGKLKKKHIRSIWGLFGDDWFNVMPLLAKTNVAKIVTPSERSMFRVRNIKKKASKNQALDEYDYHYCLIVGNVCDCPAFDDDHLKAGTWCNHLLAAKISTAIKSHDTVEMSEEDFEEIITRIISH